MRDVAVRAPNPWITAWLKGDRCREIVGAEGLRAQQYYRSLVAKRTGELAASAAVEVRIGGARHDRWQAVLEVTAPYAASHEFGTGRRGRRPQPPAHNLRSVLALMAST